MRFSEMEVMHSPLLLIFFSCPVCRYCQTPEEVADQRCMSCGSHEVRIFVLLFFFFLFHPCHNLAWETNEFLINWTLFLFKNHAIRYIISLWKSSICHILCFSLKTMHFNTLFLNLKPQLYMYINIIFIIYWLELMGGGVSCMNI